jgi:DNA-binding PadR family transcriptional regulator
MSKHGGWDWSQLGGADDPQAWKKGGPQPWKHGGPPPWVAGLLGLAQAGAGATRGAKVRRGDVRAAILDVLAVEPMNGYQVIQQIAQRSNGVWKPSPGSVYPTIQQLEDEELVEGTDQDGRRLLRLTEAGRRYVEEHPDELAATWRPFEEGVPSSTEGTPDLKPVAGQVMAAVWQVMTSGTRQQRAEAVEILAETRRQLYGLLADGEPEQ